jgi:very-short-patch-repair endonuclease
MDDTENRKRWATANAYAYCAVENNAVNNRRPMTQAETVLWEELRSNKLGVHFRRQHVIGTYIVDFVSLKNHLVIEVDGEYHLSPEQQLLDSERTRYLEQKGYRVIRFTNYQIMNNLEFVMSKLIRALIE